MEPEQNTSPGPHGVSIKSRTMSLCPGSFTPNLFSVTAFGSFSLSPLLSCVIDDLSLESQVLKVPITDQNLCKSSCLMMIFLRFHPHTSHMPKVELMVTRQDFTDDPHFLPLLPVTTTPSLSRTCSLTTLLPGLQDVLAYPSVPAQTDNFHGT